MLVTQVTMQLEPLPNIPGIVLAALALCAFSPQAERAGTIPLGRFKTLMLRKKKRPSEREAEVAQGKDQNHPKDESETDVASGLALLHMNHSENERSPSGVQMQVAETSKAEISL
ncbi:unnamed protein product [Ilex paraguariensis]|uniref:Uncharacterized protein n=1 Tax=Ilex paraguariensis TaxID=185542 RepID=A0ABC8QT25_9AQUA